MDTKGFQLVGVRSMVYKDCVYYWNETNDQPFVENVELIPQPAMHRKPSSKTYGSRTKLNYKRSRLCQKAQNPVEKQRGKGGNTIVDSSSSRSTLKKRMRADFALSGIGRILGKDRPLVQRLVWILLVGAAVLLTLYQLSTIVQYYLSHPVYTEVIFEKYETLPLPAITMCTSYNLKDRINELIGKNETLSTSEKILAAVYGAQKMENSTEWFNWNNLGRLLWPAPSLEKCIFVPSIYSYAQDVDKCSLDDFEYTPTSRAGPQSFGMSCYTLNKPKWEMYSSGGLVMTLKKTDTNGHRPVYYLIIHEGWEPPNLRESPLRIYSIDDEPTKVVVYMKESRIQLIDTACTNDAKLKYFKDYGHGKCFIECFYNFSLTTEGCNCFSPFGMPSFDKEHICPTSKMLKCFLKSSTLFEKTAQERKCGCFPTCTQYFYELTKEETLMQHDHTELNNKTKRGASQTDSPTVTLFFKFGSLNVQTLVQLHAMPPLRLFAQIGGICSLLLGFRVMSLCEIFDVLIFHFIYKISQKCTRKREAHLEKKQTTV